MHTKSKRKGLFSSHLEVLPEDYFSGKLGVLPYEPWLECIRWAIFESATGPLPYLTVSDPWSQTIIETPSLWSTIVIDDGEGVLARIHTFLHLSKHELIDIYVRDVDECGSHREVLEGIFEANSSRIRSISTPSRIHLRLVDIAINGASSYPKLESLQGSWPQNKTLNRFLGFCPALRYLGNFPLQHDSEPLLGTNIKEAFFININPKKDVLSLPRRLITSLVLLYDTPQNLAHGSPHWTNHFQHLTENVGRQLEKLVVTIPYEIYSTLHSLLSSFLVLHALSIAIIYTSNSHKTIPSTGSRSTTNLGSLRELIMTFRDDSSGNRPHILGDTNSFVSQQATEILDIWTSNPVLGSLKVLHLYASNFAINTKQLLRLVTCLKNVQELQIHVAAIRKVSNKNMEHSSIPVLARLTELRVTPPAITNYLFAPNIGAVFLRGSTERRFTPPSYIKSQVSCLDTHSSLMTGFRSTRPRSMLNGWHKLHKITIELHNYSPSISPMHHLQIIDLNTSSLTGVASYCVVNEILGATLFDAEACPQLHTIIMHSYPSWELLFAVLRHRYIRNGPRLKQITFPAFPNLSILRILAMLLGGHVGILTCRNVDSMIVQRTKHQNIRVCHYCLRAGYARCSDDNAEDESSVDENLWSLLYLDIEICKQLHQSTTEDLEYVTQAEAEIRSYRARRKCSRHSGPPAHITEHTIEGMIFADDKVTNF